jgi:hypothetical protein
LTSFGSNQSQFAGIESVAGAVRALVHFDPAPGAEEMPLQLDARAPRTFALPGPVHRQSFVALDLQQVLSRGLALVIHSLQLEGIKPNPAATSLANVHSKVAKFEFSQFVETGRAFHKLACYD